MRNTQKESCIFVSHGLQHESHLQHVAPSRLWQARFMGDSPGLLLVLLVFLFLLLAPHVSQGRVESVEVPLIVDVILLRLFLPQARVVVLLFHLHVRGPTLLVLAETLALFPSHFSHHALGKAIVSAGQKGAMQTATTPWMQTKLDVQHVHLFQCLIFFKCEWSFDAETTDAGDMSHEGYV